MKASGVAHGALRGVIGAMAMSGVRQFAMSAGVVREDPPKAILRQRATGLLESVPRRHRRAVVEIVHWSYGAVGGVGYALLPEGVRRHAWSGPAYGAVAWVAWEGGIAPALGLRQAHEPRLLERAVFLADHLLYGLVLSETRERPSE